MGNGRYVWSYTKDVTGRELVDMSEIGEMISTWHFRGESDQFVLLTALLVARSENQDYRDYNDEELDNLDYYGDRSEGQVFFAENGESGSASELETEAIDWRHTDSDVGHIWRIVSYRANSETRKVR